MAPKTCCLRYPRSRVSSSWPQPTRKHRYDTALLAPTWGEHSILHVCGEPLIAALLDAGIHVILRPHYQTARLAPRIVERLVKRFASDQRFSHVDRMEESASLFDSDLLICDWSAMAIEYALASASRCFRRCPAPRAEREVTELGLEPMEMRIRRELGTVLPLDQLTDAHSAWRSCYGGAPSSVNTVRALRDAWVFNAGRSVEVGGAGDCRIAKRAGRGAELRAPRLRGRAIWRRRSEAARGGSRWGRWFASSKAALWLSSACATLATTRRSSLGSPWIYAILAFVAR